MFDPKCTIYLDWSGPCCGKPAISRNDWGGFQCEWHDSMARCKTNPIGPCIEIKNDGTLISKIRLWVAYFMRSREVREFQKKKRR